MMNDVHPSSPESGRPNACPHCGAKMSAGDDACWLCGASLETDPAANPFASPAPPVKEPISSSTFSLTTLMLVTTLTAVVLGVLAAAPGLGILLAIVLTPALLRTVGLVSRRKQRGMPTDAGGKLMYLLSSVGLVITAAVAGSATFFGMCFVTCYAGMTIDRGGAAVGPIIFIGGTVLAVIGAIVVVVAILRKTWTLGDRR